MTKNEIKKSLQVLFPEGSAWETKYRNDFEKFLDGKAKEFLRQKERNDQITLNFFPDTTELLAEWIEIMGFPINPLLTEAQERARIKGRWRSLSVGTMQAANMLEIFNLSGINNIRIRNLGLGEDPRTFFVGTGAGVYGRVTAEYGDLATMFGKTDAADQCYLLVNCGVDEMYKIMDAMYGKSMYGSGIMYGEYTGYGRKSIEYDIPSDPDYFGLFYIIESDTGDIAEIQTNLRETFFQLACSTKPVHMWAILRVRFVG